MDGFTSAPPIGVMTGDAFLDTIPEDHSVAVEQVDDLSTASAVASSDDEDDNSTSGVGRKQHRRRKEERYEEPLGDNPPSAKSDTGVSDTPALLEEGAADHSTTATVPAGGGQVGGRANRTGRIATGASKRSALYCGGLFLLVIAVAVGIYFVIQSVSTTNGDPVGAGSDDDPRKAGFPTSSPSSLTFAPYDFYYTDNPTSSPTLSAEEMAQIDLALLDVTREEDAMLISDVETPQGACRAWLTSVDELQVTASSHGAEAVQQRYILCVLYYSTNGPNWTFNMDDDETFLDPTTHECEWEGISCSAQAVVVIYLPSLKMEGQMPYELLHLPQLQTLSLYKNSLVGTIPPGLLNMPFLEWFDVSENEFLTGTVPDLGVGSKLSVLRLQNNKFHGRLPYFESLVRLYVNENLLSSIDDQYASSTMLTKMIAYTNALGGEIPAIWNATSLVDLDIALNFWTGTIPESLWEIPNLRTLVLHGTDLKGTLPATTTSTSLQHVWLHDNDLSGPIPSTFGLNWENMKELKLYNNNLTGTVTEDQCEQWKASMDTLETDCNRESLTCSCCSECYG